MVIESIFLINVSPPNSNRIFGALAIFCVPILYGGFYISTIIAMTEISVFWLGTFRMIVALLAFIPFYNHLKCISKQDLLVNLGLGVIFLIGYIAQSFGLKTVSAGMGGFLAALFIILTPIFKRLIFKNKISNWYIIPILISFVGYYWLFKPTGSDSIIIGIGEILSIIGAVTIALHMVITEHYVSDRDPFVYAILQTMVIFIGSLLFALIFDFDIFTLEISLKVWLFIIYLGIGTTVITFVLQSYGQKYVNAVLAAIIIALEPVFATIFGMIFGNESIGTNFIIGGSLILFSAIIAILFQFQNRKEKNTSEQTDNN